MNKHHSILSILSYTFFIIIFISGCNTKKRELTELVKIWQHKKLIFSSDLETTNSKPETSIISLNSKFKIVNYIDSSECLECKLKLPSWKRLKKFTDSLSIDVEYVFISQTKHIYDLAIHLKKNNFIIPYFYDKPGSMKKENPILQHSECQTLLLDSTNNILLFGNPVLNHKLKDLYIKNMISASD